MSKGLEALKTIDKTFRYIEHDDEGYKFNEPCKMLNDCDEQFKTIEEELKRLEQIDNAKPSEARESLEFLGDLSVYHDTGNLFKFHFKEEFDIIGQALLKAQEQEQVIKECIKLLSVDGANTKAKVKELLKGLIK